MKKTKSILSLAAIFALCLSLLTVGLGATADTAYTYAPLQSFDSDNIGADCYTFSQFQGAGNEVLTYTSTTDGVIDGDKAVAIKVQAAGPGWDNFYPALAADRKDWSGYEGLVFHFAPGECPVVHSGGAEVGRFDITVEMTTGVRYTASNTVGPMYFLEDGTDAETALLVAGDNRYILPNKSGTIRMPFAALANWTDSVDMSQVKELFFTFAPADYIGNTYVLDGVQLYKAAAGAPEGGDQGEGDQPAERPETLLVQDFEAANAGETCYTFSQFQGAGNEVLTYALSTEKVTSGAQSLKLTVYAAGPGWDNFYPVISAQPDWTGYNALTVHYTPGEGTEHDGGMGRIEFAADTTTGTRYAANSAVGNLYFLADGADAEIPLEIAADGRYKLPNKAGTIRIPFTSLTGWTPDKDLSSMKEMFFGFATADYVGNVYYFDTVTLCAVPTEDSGEQEPAEPVPPLMIQNFESSSAGACMYPWTDGAGVQIALEEGRGVDGSKAGKLTIGAPNGGQVSMVLYVNMQNTDLSAGKAMMFYVENPQTDEDGYVSLAFTLEEVNGERWGVGSNKRFYLIGEDGKAEEVRNGSDMRLVIPAGFKGWVVVPERSLSLHMNSLQDGERNFSELKTLLIDAAADMMEGKTIYLDNISMSEKTADEIVAELAPDDGDEEPEEPGNTDNEQPDDETDPAPGDKGEGSPATGETTAPLLAACVLTVVAFGTVAVRKKSR